MGFMQTQARTYIFNVLLLLSWPALGQSTESGPVELRTEPWTEGIAGSIDHISRLTPRDTDILRSEVRTYSERVGRALSDVRGLNPRRRYETLTASARSYLAAVANSNARLMAHAVVTRGLFLAQEWRKDASVQTSEDYRVGADLLVLSLVLMREVSVMESRWLFSENRSFPYSEFGKAFFRRLYAIAPQASTAGRYRLTRRLVELLVWDLSRETVASVDAGALAEAQSLLSALPLEPSANNDNNVEMIRRLDNLKILPVVSMQEGESLFGVDQFSVYRSQAWQAFQHSFQAAEECGIILCATTNGLGSFLVSSYRITTDSNAQEDLIDQCMFWDRFRDGLSSQQNLICRGAMICNRSSMRAVRSCRILEVPERAEQDVGLNHERREPHSPWWINPR
jgi:hypothetical protein